MEPDILKRREIVGHQPGPHLLIVGGVHGDEFEPMAAIRSLADHVDPASLRGRLTLVPVVNEPAFRLGQRTAEDGLDLARTCPGQAEGSITERLAHALSKLVSSADFFIDLHTGGTRLGILPLVGYVLHPDPKILDQQRRMARAFNLPVIWGTDHRLQGRSLSVARDAKVPAIYAEYHGSAVCDPAGTLAYRNGCLNVMSALEMIEGEKPPSAVTHVIEDGRPNSGHLQICHPSPVAGFFQPAVTLGQRVTAGDLIGRVSNVLGTEHRSVPAEQTGIVLVLRTFPSVQPGDSLAVILEEPDA